MKPTTFLIAFALLLDLTTAFPNWQLVTGQTQFETNRTAQGSMIVNINWTSTATSGTCAEIFEFDNGGGTFTNDTPITYACKSIASGGASVGTPAKTLNSTAGTTIRWRAYSNDSTGAWNNTGINTFQTAGIPTTMWLNVTNVIDEQTLGVTGVNLTASNVTLSAKSYAVASGFTYSVQANEVLNNTFGLMTFTIANVSFYTRHLLYPTWTSPFLGLTIPTIAMLNKSDSSNIPVYVALQQANGAGVAGAYLFINKTINGQSVAIDAAQAPSTSPSSGSSIFYLHQGDAYIITGCLPDMSQCQTVSTVAVASTPITITLSNTVQANYSQSPLNDTTIYIIPNTYSLLGNVNLTLIINNTDNAIQWYAFNISWNNSQQLFFQNVTNQSGGGSLTYLFNQTLYPNGNITTIAYVDLVMQGTPTYNFTTTYLIYNFPTIANASNVSITNILPQINAGSSTLTRAVISITAVAILSSGLAGIVPLGGGIVTMILLGIFVMMFQFITNGMYLLLVIIGGALFIIRVWDK